MHSVLTSSQVASHSASVLHACLSHMSSTPPKCRTLYFWNDSQFRVVRSAAFKFFLRTCLIIVLGYSCSVAETSNILHNCSFGGGLQVANPRHYSVFLAVDWLLPCNPSLQLHNRFHIQQVAVLSVAMVTGLSCGVCKALRYLACRQNAWHLPRFY